MGVTFIPDKSKLNNFDISHDGKYKLTVVNEQTVGKYPIRFTLSDLANGSIVEEFVYNSPELNAYCKGYLSLDNSHILVISNEKETASRSLNAMVSLWDESTILAVKNWVLMTNAYGFPVMRC